MAAPIKQPNKEEYTLSLLSLLANRVSITPKMPKIKPSIKEIK
jgi:hypothetical protein